MKQKFLNFFKKIFGGTTKPEKTQPSKPTTSAPFGKIPVSNKVDSIPSHSTHYSIQDDVVEEVLLTNTVYLNSYVPVTSAVAEVPTSTIDDSMLKPAESYSSDVETKRVDEYYCAPSNDYSSSSSSSSDYSSSSSDYSCSSSGYDSSGSDSSPY